jgi:hypothetical protein
MTALIDYRGLDILTPDPTGAGGKAINDDFAELADRAGPVHSGAGNPTVDHDSDDTAGLGTKFYAWSKWRNTSTNQLYVCVDATPGAAVWVELTKTELAADASPQLGGDLDVFDGATAHAITTSQADGNVAITPNGTGNVVLDGLKWPAADGSSGQVLKTDGSTNLGWANPPIEKIAASTTLYVATTGSDATGDGTVGNPWATLAKAIDYLKDKWINGDVTVTIDVAAGTYTATSTTNLSHPCGSRITITGATPLSRTLSSIVSSSGSAFNWTLVLQLNSVAGISAGDFILIRSTSGGTLPEMVRGCHKIASVDSGNNRVTIASNHSHSTAPSGAVTGSVDIVQTVLQYNGCTGLEITQSRIEQINNLVVAGDRTTGTRGIFVNYCSTCTLGSKVGINGFRDGLYVIYNSYVYASYLTVSNCSQFGVICNYNSTAYAQYSVASGNSNGSAGYGYGAYDYSCIYAGSSTATGNLSTGCLANTCGHVDLTSGIASAHTYAVSSNYGSTLFAASATLSYATYGCRAYHMSYIQAAGVTWTSCTTNSSPAVNTVGNANSYVNN